MGKAAQKSLLSSEDEAAIIAFPTKRQALYERFRDEISPNSAFNRMLVSFQANRDAPFYNWFKYKEGFSQALVAYLLNHLKPAPGVLLDPFSGAGSALFAASELGWQAKGIEVLPVGVYATEARRVAQTISVEKFQAAMRQVLAEPDFRRYDNPQHALRHIPITRGAFPPDQEAQLVGYITYCNTRISDPDALCLLLFAAACVLEDISYTRKDGQYLRWDVRSGRSQGKKAFNKGYIPSFHEAIGAKLHQMARDLAPQHQPALFADLESHQNQDHPAPDLHQGSCLEILPTMADSSIDFVLTSPPYANRYDYTRTYALELIYLGCTEKQVKELRQAMLSCTVENRDKRDAMARFYRDIGREADFQRVEQIFFEQEALREVLSVLDAYRVAGKLNNANVARMVRNYFYEMAFVIFELSRLLRPGGIIAMVNDNVRYAGEEVPVDLILSAMAESCGLCTRHIWTLGRGKGNSSQQMGNHGRTELRKCVYVWEKEA